MWLDAFLAYLHFVSIFVLFGYLIVEMVTIKGELDAAGIRRLARADIIYFGAAIAAFVTGLLRLFYGARGSGFYLTSWPIYVKVAIFLVIGLISVMPTLTILRWRRAVDQDAAWKVPAQEQRKVRRIVMAELHLAALVPIFAVIMSRGLGR